MLPLQQPANGALIDRYNLDRQRYSPPDNLPLEVGPVPFRIPRLWNMALGALAGARQWGHQSFFDELYLPPPVIYVPHRTGAESVAMTFGRSNYADTVAVPGIFVGWNPNASRLR